MFGTVLTIQRGIEAQKKILKLAEAMKTCSVEEAERHASSIRELVAEASNDPGFAINYAPNIEKELMNLIEEARSRKVPK